MLRVIALSAGSQYCIYLEREMVEEAYWQGRGAELLQLEWERVRAKEFGDLTQRINPKTKEELKPWNGQTVTHYDAIVHAPKSLSILSLVDNRMVQAHRVATVQLMGELERLSAVWSRDGNRPTGNLIMAAFEHRQSRKTGLGEQDIHVHTHVPIINMSYDPVSDSWKALRAEPIFHNRHELTEQYRTTLARRVQSLGYSIADKPRVGFEIAGVPKETIQRYSHRSAEIQEALQLDNRKITIQNVARWTRNSGKEVVPPEPFRQQQLEKLTHAERQHLRQTVERAYERRHKLGIHVGDDAYDEGPRIKPWSYGQRVSM